MNILLFIGLVVGILLVAACGAAYFITRKKHKWLLGSAVGALAVLVVGGVGLLALNAWPSSQIFVEGYQGNTRLYLNVPHHVVQETGASCIFTTSLSHEQLVEQVQQQVTVTRTDGDTLWLQDHNERFVLTKEGQKQYRLRNEALAIWKSDAEAVIFPFPQECITEGAPDGIYDVQECHRFTINGTWEDLKAFYQGYTDVQLAEQSVVYDGIELKLEGNTVQVLHA